MQTVAMIAAAVTLRFALFGCSGVAAHKGAYGALFKVRCMVAEHMARAPLGALNERRTGDIKTVLNEEDVYKRQVVGKVADTGRTALVVTHDPEFILRCCHYVLHLENGKIQESYSIENSDGRNRLLKFFLNDMEKHQSDSKSGIHGL